MTHVVTGRCIDCRYTDCAEICPVDCFYRIEDPAMLVIDPDGCIDCSYCVPVCPAHAIYLEDAVPEPYQEWTARNAELAPLGVLHSTKIAALPGALTLAQIQERERAQGWDIAEPEGGLAEGDHLKKN
jgi:ferredoxin